MAKSTTLVPQKKKPGPKPTGKGVQVVVRCDKELLDKIDEFRADNVQPKTRAASFRLFATWFFSIGPKPRRK